MPGCSIYMCAQDHSNSSQEAAAPGWQGAWEVSPQVSLWVMGTGSGEAGWDTSELQCGASGQEASSLQHLVPQAAPITVYMC